jgi:L-arabinose isomerase
MQPNVHIGLMGIGLQTYWLQFEGLKPRLEKYVATVANNIQQGTNCTVVNVGLVDSYDAAIEAASTLQQKDIGLLFVYSTTYALSATVLPVIKKCKVPVILLNITPTKAIDYAAFNAMNNRTAMTGEWLAFCGACPVPEISNVLKRANIPFKEIVGTLETNDECWNEIQQWVEAAKVAHIMQYNKMGVMGHYYSGMLDIYTDVTKQLIVFGGHVEVIEVDELSALKEKVTTEAVQKKLAEFTANFDIQPDCSDAELTKAAVTSVALDALVQQYHLGSLAYYYKGTGVAANEATMSSIILGTSLLTANHIPVAGEYEIKNVQAMKIMDSFNAGGSFSEYYAVDFNDDVVLFGHDGPGHLAIASGKTKVKPLQVYHGKVGSGLSVEMSVQHGAVTLLSVIEDGNGLAFLIAEGESVAGPILEIGNTNSRYKFSIEAKQFIQQWNSYGPAHHCAIGIGHISNKLEKLAFLLQIPVYKVC